MGVLVSGGTDVTLAFCCLNFQGGAVIETDIEATLSVEGLYLATSMLVMRPVANGGDTVAGNVELRVVQQLGSSTDNVCVWRETWNETDPRDHTATLVSPFRARVGTVARVVCHHTLSINSADPTDSEIGFQDDSQRSITLLAAGRYDFAFC